MAYLQIKTKDGAKRFLVDGAGVTIGRQLGNIIHINDDMASRFHAIVEPAGENIHVKDLDSRNGLKVNGQVAKQQALSDGDVIQIGRTKIVFRTGQTEAVENQLKHFADESTDQPQTALQSLAESLPSKSFNIADLQVLNTRGQVVHGSQAKDEDGKKAPGEAVTLLRLILLVCFRTRASDIHIEPKSEHTLVRVRIDGTMVDIAKLKADVGHRLGTVVKVLCDIDLHGKNVVQEGSFAAKVPDRRVDYRVSFSPSVSGQKLVIRVLDEANAPRYMWELGLPEPVFKALDKSMKRDAGTVIVCGPTGSGKTATLYATLRSIDQNERNVVTIEDPVEIRLEGITQMPVDEDKGNTFAELLRSTLRQDPDVILVGEIRDSETATTAIQAAMTGHLVFSTIHARDTVGSIFRLQDLGVEPYALANGLQNLIAQRLVRKLCSHCKVAKPLSEDDKEVLGEKAEGVSTIYKEHGCRRCLGTGFAGRCGVYELLTVTDDVRDAIASGAGQAAVLEALKSTKFRRLRDAGNDLVVEGVTTLDEIDRVLGS